MNIKGFDNKVKLANRKLNNIEFNNQEIFLKSLPRAIFVELTQNCNLNCSHCKNLDEVKYQPKFDMKNDLFQLVANQLFPTAELVDLRGWGESTILKFFPEIVSITESYDVQIRLVSNGMNSNPQIWDQLMAANAMVALSCDTADPDLFSVIRGGGDLNRLRNTVNTIVKFRDEYNVPVDNVYFNSVVSTKNINKLPELLEFAYKLGLKKIVFFPIMVDKAHPWHLSNDIEATNKGLITAHEFANKLGITLQLGAAFDESLRIREDIKTMCINPWAYTFIDYSGGVGFCDHLIGNPKYIFGSLSKNSFQEIWNGREFRKLRKTHKRGGKNLRNKNCRWCYNMRYVDIENLFHQKFEDKIVSNRTRLKLS